MQNHRSSSSGCVMSLSLILPVLIISEKPSGICSQGIPKIILSGVRPEVMEDLERSRIAFMIGKSNIFGNFDDALKKAGDLSSIQLPILNSALLHK